MQTDWKAPGESNATMVSMLNSSSGSTTIEEPVVSSRTSIFCFTTSKILVSRLFLQTRRNEFFRNIPWHFRQVWEAREH